MVQSRSTLDTSSKDENMPMYMHPIKSGYRFRRVVPEALRSSRPPLLPSNDYARACRRAREEAVRSATPSMRLAFN